MDEFAVNENVTDGPVSGLAEVGPVDGGRRLEPMNEVGEVLGAADAAGGERGRDDDAGIVEVYLYDVQRGAGRGAARIGYRIGRGELGGKEETEKSGKRQKSEGEGSSACPTGEEGRMPAAFFQSRMSSRFQPKASSKQSPATWEEPMASSRRVHQTWSPASCLPRGGEMSACAQLAQVGT